MTPVARRGSEMRTVLDISDELLDFFPPWKAGSELRWRRLGGLIRPIVSDGRARLLSAALSESFMLRQLMDFSVISGSSHGFLHPMGGGFI